MQAKTEQKHHGLIPVDFNISKWPWWAIVLILTGLALSILILTSKNYNDTFIYLTLGVKSTLRITLFSFLLATVLGLITGLARVSKNVFLFNASTLYVEIVRGIPLVVLMLYIAFALVPVLVEMIKAIGVWGITSFPNIGLFQSLATFSIRVISMEGRAIIALGFGYGAYEAEVFRAGIQSISKGQMEAAKSLGMNYLQCMRFIILPQAIRRVLPPLGNDFIAHRSDRVQLQVAHRLWVSCL